MIKPEQVKKLAEFMGYKILDKKRGITQSVDDVRKLVHGGYIYLDSFNPLENADQCLELVEKLYIYVSNDGGCEWYTSCEPHSNEKIVTAKTINEAVTLAAIAYVERLEG